MYRYIAGIVSLLIIGSLLFTVFYPKQVESVSVNTKPMGSTLSLLINPYLQLKKTEQVAIPSHYSTYEVSDVVQLWQALGDIKKENGNSAIIFDDGVYALQQTINIDMPNVMLLSKSADPTAAILRGTGMYATETVNNIIRVSASGFVLDGLTLRATGNHLIQIAAEQNADIPVIRNCVLQDSYQQLLKVSYNKNKPDNISDAGLIEYCLFEYTAGIGPNYYIGGIDAHGIHNWIIRHNTFKDIASPAERIAEHAIHIWNNSADNIVEGNVIIDSDRGIGFGMRLSHSSTMPSNYRGIIKDNMIYHADNGDLFADVGIILEDSPGTVIEGNWVYMEHDYPNAIEYRYSITRDILINDNHVNRDITSRDLGRGQLQGNKDIPE